MEVRVPEEACRFLAGFDGNPLSGGLFEVCARLGGRTCAASVRRRERVVDTPLSSCSVCERTFQVRFRYQVREDAGSFQYFCSQMCQQRSLTGGVERG